MNLASDSYEFQMLYGVRLNLPDEIVRRGLIRKQPAESAESFDLTCGCLLSILERKAAKKPRGGSLTASRINREFQIVFNLSIPLQRQFGQLSAPEIEREHPAH
jgi:hypothetical protein